MLLVSKWQLIFLNSNQVVILKTWKKNYRNFISAFAYR